MSRSLGDLYAHEVGVSPEPVINTYSLGDRDLFVVSERRVIGQPWPCSAPPPEHSPGCLQGGPPQAGPGLPRRTLCCWLELQAGVEAAGGAAGGAAAGPPRPCRRAVSNQPSLPASCLPAFLPLQILATDGLWDIMNNEEAADFVEM